MLQRLCVRPQLSEASLAPRLSMAQAALANGDPVRVLCSGRGSSQDKAAYLEWILLELSDLGVVVQGPVAFDGSCWAALVRPVSGPRAREALRKTS